MKVTVNEICVGYARGIAASSAQNWEGGMKHKHYDLIIAWANGAEIEIKNGCGEWLPLGKNSPGWGDHFEYRIAKPKPRKETRWLWADKEGYTSTALCAEPPNEAFTIKLEWSATAFEVEQ